MSDEQVEVIQADREAAAIELERHGHVVTPAMVRAGDGDSFPTVQAFARHRLAHSAPSALPEDDGKLHQTAEQTLADIWQSLPGFAARLQAYGVRVRAETLEEAAKVADGIAEFACKQAARQPAEWTSAAETAELIASKLRSLTTGSAAGQDGAGK